MPAVPDPNFTFVEEKKVEKTAIYYCLNSEYDLFNKVKLAAVLKNNDLQSVVKWDKINVTNSINVNFNTSKT